MRIAAGTVSYEGYGDPRANDQRLTVFRRALQQSLEKGVNLVCMPGGYLRASSENDRDGLANILAVEGEKHNIAFAVGIDVSEKNIARDLTQFIRRYALPWFAISWSPAERTLHCWRERSTNSVNYRVAPRAVCSEPRTLPVAEGAVEVLMCGDIFNPIIRENVISRRDGINAVVDLGHESKGFRVFQGMKKLSEGGLVTLCSVHASRRYGQKFRYDPGVVCRSSRDTDILLDTEPRVELKIWSF